jgi:hypothetical protein
MDKATPREFWIQKGTLDIIADSFKEMESSVTENREAEIHHVIEKTPEVAKSVELFEELVEFLEKLQHPSNKAFLSIEVGTLSQDLLQRAKAAK